MKELKDYTKYTHITKGYNNVSFGSQVKAKEIKPGTKLCFHLNGTPYLRKIKKDSAAKTRRGNERT